jgi:hypothetical protein
MKAMGVSKRDAVAARNSFSRTGVGQRRLDRARGSAMLRDVCAAIV